MSPRQQRGDVGLRVLPLLLGALIVLALAAQGSLGVLLLLPIMVWLAWPQPSPPATASTPDSGGAERLLRPLLPLWSGQIDTLQAQLQSGVDELLASFAQIVALQDQLSAQIAGQSAGQPDPRAEPDLSQARALATSMGEHCDAAMHGLQFGDRVHQMLDVIKADQRRLLAELDSLAGMDEAAVQRWLAALRERYTTDEQHATHRGEAPPGAGRESVEFF